MPGACGHWVGARGALGERAWSLPMWRSPARPAGPTKRADPQPPSNSNPPPDQRPPWPQSRTLPASLLTRRTCARANGGVRWAGAAGSERCAGRAMRCGAGINAALARRRRRRSGLAHRCGEHQCRERAGIGWARAERLRACGAVPERVGSAHRPIGGVGVHVHLDAGSWPSWTFSMQGACVVWWPRHERPETARRGRH